jgi:hypothetical protein
MKVTTISASVRFSKALGDGQHKTVELGAEAVIASLTESWQEAQAQLYAELSQQLKALWGNGNGHHPPADGSEVGERVQSNATPPGDPEHWCEEHRAVYHRHEGKNGSAWYSHKAPDGSWCREK